MSQQLVFETIPGRPSSHCATLTECADGSILAAWYSGAREGALDVAIMAARVGRTSPFDWSDPWVLHDTPGLSDGNPTLYTLADGRIILFFVTIQGQGWDTARAYTRRSSDGGRTWTEPVRFGDGDGLMFRSRPLRLSSGRLVLPVYDEITWDGLPFISDDGGGTWRPTERLTGPDGCIQPAVVELADGSLLAYLRTGGEDGWIRQSRSTDGGETWSSTEPTALPNPNSGIDLIRLTDGRLLLAYNPVRHGRERLDVAVSDDGGETWRSEAVAADAGREYSYPQLMQDSSGRCHLLYTYRRESIKHAIIEP